MAYDISLDFSIIQILERKSSLDEGYRMLRCLFLPWSTSYDLDHKVKSGLVNSNMRTLQVGKWYSMEPLDYIEGALLLLGQAQQCGLSRRTCTTHFTGSLQRRIQPSYSFS